MARRDRRAPDLPDDAHGGESAQGGAREEAAMTPSARSTAARRAGRTGRRPQGASSRAQRTLREQLAENDRLLRDTGHLFGLRRLRRKDADPGAYEAVWQILLNVCNTAHAVGCKVSSSPIAAEGGDALWSLHLATGEAVCTSKGIVSHPGLLTLLLRSYIEDGYEDVPGFRPGDIFENNDPHFGGIHSADFQTTVPIFHGGRLVAWAGSVTHVMDSGFVLPGSIGFLNPDCFSDGLPVVAEKVGEDDRFFPWYEKRVRARTRVPDWVMGDARGRLAGCLTIRDRVVALIDKYGLELFEDVTREYVEDSRRYAVSRVRTQAVPGRIQKSNFKDLAMAGKRVLLPQQDVDCLFHLPLEVRIGPDAEVTFSLRGASGWVPFGENLTPSALVSALLNAYSHMIGFDMFNWGAVAAWSLETPPPGSWANPYPENYFASSGVGWAPAVLWMSSLYEAFGRLFYARGYLEEVAAGAATTMTAEFSGTNQYGMYTAGLTLEQASNGSPARAIGDGENSAWCVYTPNADFGNAEVSELYYPVLYLGRNLEPDSGGYGAFRGGLGHTAVWLVKNTPGIEYQCGCAGIRSKICGNHGMFGAYPTWPDRSGYASGTDVKERIEARLPLVHERGDPERSDLAARIHAERLEDDAVAPFVTPEPLHEYDLIVHPVSGSQALGDPIERDPERVRADLDQGWTRERVAHDVHGVVARFDEAQRRWEVDAAATAARRAEMRRQRLERAVPFRDWWKQERAKVLAREGMAEAVLGMWRSSMRLSPDWAQELRAFWHLPEDFSF
jgi:N-methylhydantoinase B/oxoprolinase/acetone carboxylase alpha subunit